MTKWEDMGAEAVLSLNDVHGGLGDVTGRMDEMKKLQEESLGQRVSKSIKRNTGGVRTTWKEICRIS